MKWPEWLMLIRHDTSEYNVLKGLKEKDELYQRYLAENEKDYCSPETVRLAREVLQKYTISGGSAGTQLVDENGEQPHKTGLYLAENYEKPDVIFVSPYVRTKETLRHITRGWKALEDVKTYEEHRIREQEYGLGILYNDWKILQTLHPEQKFLYEKEGRYWYRHMQGESVCDVRDRALSWMNTIIRDFAGKKVLVVTHHLTILSVRANLERFDAKEFLRLDEEEKPINCGVTLYKGEPKQGKQGRLMLESYNKKYY